MVRPVPACTKGTTVRLLVTSGVAASVHVDGCGIETRLRRGRSCVVERPAEQRRVFELETDGGGRQLARLEVR